MAEHADGDVRKKRSEVELPPPTLIVSYSPLTPFVVGHIIVLILVGEEGH